MYFFLPFNYLIISRLRTKHSKTSWMLVYVIPQFLLFGSSEGFSIDSFIQFVLLFLSFYTLYECGYLFNDLITTKNEHSPNYRLPFNEIEKLREDFRSIILIKCIVATFLLVAYWSFFSNELILHLLVWSTCFLCFYLHNLIRSNWNILTYSFLCYFKFIAVLELENIEYSIVFLLFPLIRSIEHSMKNKYSIQYPNILKNLDFNRVIYYLFITIILYLFTNSVFLFIAIYYFFVRFSIYIVLKSKFEISRD